MRTLTKDTVAHVSETVELRGWVQSRRDHGGLIFIDVRDHTGIAQLVIQPETAEAFAVAEQLRDEFVIAAIGVIRDRDEHLKNPNIATGAIEIKVESLVILNRSEPLPIQIQGEAMANEELRLKYRYLDLRRPKMQQMLKRRAEYYHRMRSYLEERDFTEVTTPILANSSPEGARDFLIPSRVHPGKFYALPQAPQQFKQLLMVGGVPRYYQLAAAFRDEDPRADRLYGEFYQLDLEMSFVEDGEEVRSMVEPLIKQLTTDFAGKRLLSEDIPRIPYVEAMERFGSDKPDLRFGMELVELSDELRASGFGVFAKAIADGGCVKVICVRDAASLTRSQIDHFTEIAKSEGAGGLAYLTFEQGEIKSPIAKFLQPEELQTIQSKTGAADGDIVFFGADKRVIVNKVLGRLRGEFASHFNLKDPNVIALAWIVDFPFYEWDDKIKKLDFGHNPFSMPKGGLEALESEDKLAIVADQYDMVMNGYEICSGGVRNHNPDVLYEVFNVLGYDKAYVESRFGAMINAFKYGAPPHAGCAFGIDRMFMVLQDEENIREVVAFPKNGSGMDTMMGSPSAVEPGQLKELSIKPVHDQ
ncbi:MAG TPA: aspartate--tRNA ligase [Candidatus Limnocylindrales bacterium]|nr:aspartate--tRNA ligase [Candidatus Limnocylindrales bacterium]